MSRRYECYNADQAGVELLAPGSDPEEHGLDLDDGHYVLVIGDPWAAAAAVAGSAAELRAFARRVTDLIERELPGERPHLDSHPR